MVLSILSFRNSKARSKRPKRMMYKLATIASNSVALPYTKLKTPAMIVKLAKKIFNMRMIFKIVDDCVALMEFPISSIKPLGTGVVLSVAYAPGGGGNGTVDNEPIGG